MYSKRKHYPTLPNNYKGDWKIKPSIRSLEKIPTFYQEMKKSKISTLSVSLTCDQLFSLSFYGLIRIFKLIMRVFSLSILRVKTFFFKVIFATNMARLDQGITLNQNTTLRANGNINQMMLLRKSTGLNYEKIIRSVFAFWSSSN